MDRDQMQFLGTGLYSEREAARLTGVRVQRLKRWVHGYEFTTPAGKRHASPPVLDRGVGELETPMLGFSALVDVRVVRAFRDAGVSWPVLREAARIARERLGVEHPFSDKRFKTDGKEVFLALKRGRRDQALLEIRKDQYVFPRIIEPFLLTLDFEGNEPCRWFPLGKKRHVLLDPDRSFGQPITREGSVATSIIAAAVAAEKSAARVARWYGIPLNAVKDAVEFEARLAA
ncbi:MAG: hypothetical protein ACYC4P_07275 [Thermoanaerobaculia bacterium]